MTDTYIEKTLVKYFYSIVVDLIVNEGWSLNYRTASFVRPQNLRWFDVFFVANEPFQKELGNCGRNRYTGFLQININYNVSDISQEDILGSDDEVEWAESSTSNPDYVYNLISRGFRRGLIVDKGIRIAKISRTSSAVLDDNSDHYTDIVTVYWQSDLSID